MKENAITRFRYFTPFH